MALIVEDGTAKVDAESFNTLAEIAAYATKYGLTWTVVTADGEVAAREAFQYMEAVYGGQITGSRQTSTQSASWPRNYAEDSELEPGGYTGTYYVPSSTVPTRWKEAHAILSVKALTEDLIPDLANPGSIKSKSVQVGPISKSVEYAGANSPVKWFRLVDLLISRYLQDSAVLKRA